MICTSLSTCKRHCGQGTSSTRRSIQWPVDTTPKEEENLFYNFFRQITQPKPNPTQPPKPLPFCPYQIVAVAPLGSSHTADHTEESLLPGD